LYPTKAKKPKTEMVSRKKNFLAKWFKHRVPGRSVWWKKWRQKISW
jgi:hypothetical protein